MVDVSFDAFGDWDEVINLKNKPIDVAVLGDIAFEIQKLAKTYAPYKTGFLMNHIIVEKISDTHWLVGTDCVYAPIQEFGLANHVPHPHMFKAMYEVADSLKTGELFSRMIPWV